jgi:hypothetical protein
MWHNYFQKDWSLVPNLTIHTTCHISRHLATVTFLTWKLFKQRVFTGKSSYQFQSNDAFYTHTHIILRYTEYKIIVDKLKSHNYNELHILRVFLASSKLETL